MTSVRIENFKCIEDSTEFTLKPVTCLVGKNESGKTAILQALYKLNPDIPEQGDFAALLEYPRRKWSEYKERHDTNPDNVLTTEWELEDTDIEALTEEFGLKILKNKTITITKGYDNIRYARALQIDEKQILKYYLNSSDLEAEELNELKNSGTISELMDKLKTKESPSEHESNLLETLNKKFPDGDPAKAIIAVLEKRLPIFLFFAEFYKMLGKVSMDDLVKRRKENSLEQRHRIFDALLNLVGTDAEDMNRIGRFEELVAELEAISNRLSEEIFEYWSQNKYLQVDFRFDAARPEDPPPYNGGFIFHTRIRNTRHGVTVSFDERSAGFVWFFSFLIWFSQLKRTYGDHLFILLDDPGLSLHARAQADLLRYINEKLKPNYQVIYTTHSPFMIDPDNLTCARTLQDIVTRGGKVLGTKVKDEVLGVDPDTIFPLQAALGYDITQTLFVGPHTLLVEGPSDLLYLKLFSKELQEAKREYLDPRWVITPCGGIGKIGSFIALFGSKKLHVAVLTDYHKGIKAKVRSLRESNLLKTGHVFSTEMYVSGDEADVEDMIGRLNYIKLVNECYSLDETSRLPEEKASGAPTRVIEEVENHFGATSTEVEFDHYSPALFLTENRSKLREFPELDQSLDRFEKLFKDLNELLS